MSSGDGVAEREHGGGRRDQRTLAQFAGRPQRSRRPVAHRVRVRAEEPVDRELDHERDRVGSRPVGKLIETCDETRVRFVVAAEQALDAGARRGQLHAKADRVGRGERDALEQVGMALGEAALRGERACPRQQELDSLLRGASSGRRRSAALNHRAALAGARSVAAVPASVSTATAARSP